MAKGDTQFVLSVKALVKACQRIKHSVVLPLSEEGPFTNAIDEVNDLIGRME